MENLNRETEQTEEIKKFEENEALNDMETTGYTTIFVGPPLQSDVDEVQKKFEDSRKLSKSGIVFCEGESECKRFLGTDDENTEVNATSFVREI